ncbi:MAG: uroporphyrinogen-III synthase [Leeuwenhoekiella sp.]|nr:uroporphyrinogen-III synthase [Leeuwenhoekiella sp.]MBA80076.1 uroporphyrinogen-III synthase [Leeuwenhoekiella sp.]
MKAPSPSRERAGVRVLSTKKLTPSQKNLILGAGFSMVEYVAIKIDFLDFNLPQQLENLIFTSQNAVKAFLKKLVERNVSNANVNQPPLLEERAGVRCFCVGSKTEALLLKNGLKVVKTGQNASELADFITKNYKNEHFCFFCGNKRRDELPQILNENRLRFQEIEVYKTSLNNKKFEQKFDAVLFFSPSGVQSFAQQNSLENTLAVCIGNTTAAEVQNYTDQFTVANATTIESVIARAVKALN